jgi:hypothetical protein
MMMEMAAGMKGLVQWMNEQRNGEAPATSASCSWQAEEHVLFAVATATADSLNCLRVPR